MTAPDPSDATRDPLTAQQDLHGLAVHDADDLLTGHVFGLLCESDTGLIRFLDVELDGKNRHVLVPVGHARLEPSALGPRIRLRAASLDDLESVPPYAADGAWPNAELAREVVAAHGRSFRGDKYYAHPAYDHRGLYAGEHPIVKEGDIAPGDETAAAGSSALESLNQLKDYRVADHESDIRGWMLVDARERTTGTVTDLLIDTDALKVRYLVVQRPDDSKMLLPIGYVEVRAEQNQVVTPGLTMEDLLALPGFDGLRLSKEAEENLRSQIEIALDARNPFLRVDFSHRKMVA